ncbi:MAG TPA: TolC family protein, partial [Rhodanobacteraceae bacterium]|nr:TolC family protein [Rhodanobacteraceae bacterium]
MTIRPLLVVVATTLLAACAGAPGKLPPPVLRDQVPLAGLPMQAAATWPDAQWWRRYRDPQLDRLIGIALHGSTSLATARSRVENAAQAVRLAAAQAGLRIDGSAQVARHRMSEHGLIPTRFLGFTWYNQGDIGAQLQYDFDWWGKQRATIEAAVGQVRAAEAQRSAAALALQSAVADTWFGWLADQARLQVATQQVQVARQLLRIADVRARAGVQTADASHQAQAQLAAARQQQAALQGSAA